MALVFDIERHYTLGEFAEITAKGRTPYATRSRVKFADTLEKPRLINPALFDRKEMKPKDDPFKNLVINPPAKPVIEKGKTK
jgi:hypothetical protein